MKTSTLNSLAVAALAMWLMGWSGVAHGQDNESQAEISSEPALGSTDDAHADDDHDEGSHSDGDHGDGGHAAGEHENDPTSSNISPPSWELVDFRSDMAFFSAIVFLLLLFGLASTAWKPIIEGLEKREQGIADNIANADRASAEAEAKLAEYEAKLSQANQEAQQILADARKDAEATSQKLIAAAQEEAARAKDRSLADIESAKRVALNDLANQSSEVAMTLAKRVVGREVKAEDHQSLIQDMLSKLPSQN